VLRFGGRSVVGFGLSASASTFAQANVDLQNQIVAVVGAGNTYFDENVATFDLDFTDATEAYQAAGQAGATSLGPEIDASGAPTVTKPLTGQAWTLNAQLAALQKSGAVDAKNNVKTTYFTQTDALKAKALVTQMVGLYDQAIAKGSAAIGQPQTATANASVTPPLPAPTAQAPSFLPVVALGAVVAAVATVLVTRSPRRSHGIA
jgi:hypothetical protein